MKRTDLRFHYLYEGKVFNTAVIHRYGKSEKAIIFLPKIYIKCISFLNGDPK